MHTHKHIQRERYPSATNLLPRCPQHLGLDRIKASSQELHLGLLG